MRAAVPTGGLDRARGSSGAWGRGCGVRTSIIAVAGVPCLWLPFRACVWCSVLVAGVPCVWLVLRACCFLVRLQRPRQSLTAAMMGPRTCRHSPQGHTSSLHTRRMASARERAASPVPGAGSGLMLWAAHAALMLAAASRRRHSGTGHERARCTPPTGESCHVACSAATAEVTSRCRSTAGHTGGRLGGAAGSVGESRSLRRSAAASAFSNTLARATAAAAAGAASAASAPATAAASAASAASAAAAAASASTPSTAARVSGATDRTSSLASPRKVPAKPRDLARRRKSTWAAA
mmetsp:Transcript_9162/g.35841  ORF Transcript_9162/g.35841 Transcript_9162/m.35841 type:complete len:294 (-) Transcript_9162:1440-2321(-)